MLQTLGNALSCARYHNLLQRYAGLIEMAIRSNLIDSFGSGVIVTGPGWSFLAPTYYTGASSVFAGCRILSAAPRSETGSNLPWHLAEPDLSATPQRKWQARAYLRREFHCRKYSCAVPPERLFGWPEPPRTFCRDRENRGDSEAMNTADDPGRVGMAATPVSATGSEPQYVFEPYTLTLLELAQADR